MVLFLLAKPKITYFSHDSQALSVFLLGVRKACASYPVLLNLQMLVPSGCLVLHLS